MLLQSAGHEPTCQHTLQLLELHSLHTSFSTACHVHHQSQHQYVMCDYFIMYYNNYNPLSQDL